MRAAKASSEALRRKENSRRVAAGAAGAIGASRGLDVLVGMGGGTET